MADTQQVRDTSQPTQANLASQFAAADSFLAGWCEQRRYEIKEVIGRGSYGVVCAAVDKVTKERVAIKKIQNVFDNVADATRILREIKLLKLLKHPDVVEIKHIMLPPDPRTYKDLYVVFELLESDLHTVIGANDDLTQDHHKVFLYQLLRGLNYVHSSGVLHRDLKPKNILANSNCKLKICDFGLARPFLTDAPVSPVHWTDYVATRWYRAPELCGCFYGRYTQAVDIWSVGCIFAEVLLGKPLFPGRDAPSMLHLITDLLGKPPPHVIERIANHKARAFLHAMPAKQPKNLAQKFTNASPEALRLLQRLLAFDPLDRPTAAEALADPYFANLPNATQQEPANYSRQIFDFELRKLETADVRALIYQEALTYQPFGAVAAMGAAVGQPNGMMYAPVSMPGGQYDMRYQFKVAEHAEAAAQHAAQQAAAAAAKAQQKAAQQMAPVLPPGGVTGASGPALTEYRALWYKQMQTFAGMGGYGGEGVLSAEQQAAVLQYQQQLAALQQQPQMVAAQCMNH